MTFCNSSSALNFPDNIHEGAQTFFSFVNFFGHVENSEALLQRDVRVEKYGL